MKSEELTEIEEYLDITLPTFYKEFQLHYPTDLIEHHFNEEYFSKDPKYIVEINKNWKKSGLPEDYFSIGNDIGGNYFFIKLTSSDQTVYYLDHEEASETEIDDEDLETGSIDWGNYLSPNHNNLNEFKDWLIETWGDVLPQLNKKK